MIQVEGEEAEIARRYIKIIEERTVVPRKIAIKKAIEKVLEEPKKEPRIEVPKEVPKIEEVLERPKVKVPKEEVKEIVLEEVLKEKVVSVELELDKGFTIEGRGITRWLSTSPGIIEVQKEDLDRLRMVAEKIGTTYLHIWDQSGRRTLRIEVIPVRYVVEYLPEAYRRKLEEEAVEPFKFSYSFNRHAFYRGKELSSAERTESGL